MDVSRADDQRAESVGSSCLDQGILPKDLTADVPPLDPGNVGPSKVPSISSIVEAIQLNKSLEFVGEVAGQQLTSGNFNEVGLAVHQAVQQTIDANKNAGGESKLNQKERALLDGLSRALEAGDVPAKGSLGNKFRSMVDISKWQGLGHAEAKAFRLDWAQDLKTTLEEKKEHSKSWKRIDSTHFTYRPFGRLVLDLGGWTDPDAVQGATHGVLQCIMMGDPFVKVHPQTKMLIFAIADISWTEQFEKCWSETVTYYGGDSTKGAASSALTDVSQVPAETGAVVNGSEQLPTPSGLLRPYEAYEEALGIALKDALSQPGLEKGVPNAAPYMAIRARCKEPCHGSMPRDPGLTHMIA